MNTETTTSRHVKALKFVRVQRTCGHNDQVIAKGAPFKGMIYDFEVWRDEERIAEFHRISYGVGYALYDRAGEIVPDPECTWRTQAIQVRAQADFAATIEKHAALIPNAIQIADRAFEAMKARQEEAARDAEAERIAKIEKAGPELLRAIDIVVQNASLIPDPKMEGLTDCYRVPLEDIDTLRALIAKVTT